MHVFEHAPFPVPSVIKVRLKFSCCSWRNIFEKKKILKCWWECHKLTTVWLLSLLAVWREVRTKLRPGPNATPSALQTVFNPLTEAEVTWLGGVLATSSSENATAWWQNQLKTSDPSSKALENHSRAWSPCFSQLLYVVCMAHKAFLGQEPKKK